ncbi:MAG: CpsD/CapB family tyrosine-protein kinase, partial [Acidobacteriota bacterium]
NYFSTDVPKAIPDLGSAMILLGLFLSLGLGLGLAWMLENLNTKVRTVDDLARATQLPMLAVIPKLDEASPGAISALTRQLKDGADSSSSATENPFTNFSAAEAYRMLRTSVLLSTADHPPRTILVTSGEPGDGKTTTIINTAVTLTQLKAKVLLIDCDMRKPRVHRLAGIENSEGLSSYLSNGGEVSDFIKPTGIPNLFILPSGRIPPNPSELISSLTMKTMLQRLTEEYDYVLIDSPPVATVTDPIILSTLVEGVILVAKSGKTKSEVLRRITHDLLSRRAKVLGVVLNNLDVRRNGYGYEYYYYDYKHHYSDKEDKREVAA